MAKILVIEDDRSWQTLMVQWLNGHVVTTVGTLGEGLAAVEREDWDIILLDLGLPDAAEGWGAWRAIVEKSDETPLLIVTGGLREPQPLQTISVVGKDRLSANRQLLNTLVATMLHRPPVV